MTLACLVHIHDVKIKHAIQNSDHVFSHILLYSYSGPCDLRPPIQPAKYGLKLKGVLK